MLVTMTTYMYIHKCTESKHVLYMHTIALINGLNLNNLTMVLDINFFYNNHKQHILDFATFSFINRHTD